MGKDSLIRKTGCDAVPKKQVELAPRREVVKNDFVFYSLRNLEDVQKDRSRHSASKGTQRR